MRLNSFLLITLINILFNTFYPTLDVFSGLHSYRKLNNHSQCINLSSDNTL